MWRFMYERVYGWMYGCMDGCMDGWDEKGGLVDAYVGYSSKLSVIY